MQTTIDNETLSDAEFWRQRNEQLLAPFSAEVREWVRLIKKHASQNYESGGWDIVAEAMEVNEIAEEVAGALSYEEALKRIAESVGARNEYREDIQSTAF
jgi:hypothetical protein